MISLDPETAEIAGKMDNFSMWVRAQLLKVKNGKNKRRFKYTCHVCEYNFHASSIDLDKFFYCPNYMRGKHNCTNTETLDGVEI